tara:strand:- start:7090 stop:7323 length:234 start_codon:yes stop_codon:yes gene_type:complete
MLINDNHRYTYVGYTTDLDKRLKLHNNSKGAKFTKGNNWSIIYKKRYNTKSIAMKNEYILKKNRKLRKFIKEKFLKH